MIFDILIKLIIAICAFLLGIIFTIWVWGKSPDGTMELGVNPEDDRKPAVVMHMTRDIESIQKRGLCILKFKGLSEDL